MGSSLSCLVGRRAEVPAETIKRVEEEPIYATPELDTPHDSAHSGTSSRRSSVRRSIPISISLPDLTAHSSTKDASVPQPAFATPPNGSVAAAISSSDAMSRMHSVKDAARDAAMEAALRNFEAKIAADSSQALGRDLSSAPANWATTAPVEIQERGLCSAPELFSDAAMRNALRKIAAMQLKQEQAPQRARGGSQGGSGKSSHRPSVDDENQHNRAACATPFGRAEAARILLNGTQEQNNRRQG
ncbi:hypothetical protein COCOBI_06-3930 [Coccomyxa sp. Obi]|nr:hypothetical protein COCOBI_06-3930 [Coccomyxa sp. Obi]